MSDSKKKAVIVISSHVVRGSIGNRAAVFALETLSFPVWTIQTIILPWHPGHGLATRIIPDDMEFANLIEDITNAPWIGGVGAVLTGYMASVGQVETVAGMIAALKQKNPELLYLCDPVIGDAGGLYVSNEIAAAIRDKLIPLCDITTPNRFELAWLQGGTPSGNAHATLGQAKELGSESVLVTSSAGLKDNQIGNLLWDENNAYLASHARIDHVPNGTGDLTASLYLAHRLEGMSPQANLQMTTATVFEIINQSVNCKSSELTLESGASKIIDPQMNIAVTRL